MIVKKENTRQKQFKGVSFDILAVGEKTMITLMKYNMGDIVPFHSHPNEQCGYVVSGKFRIKYLDIDEVISQGDSYAIPENIDHSFEVIEPGEIIDVFTPPREDYL